MLGHRVPNYLLLCFALWPWLLISGETSRFSNDEDQLEQQQQHVCAALLPNEQVSCPTTIAKESSLPQCNNEDSQKLQQVDFFRPTVMEVGQIEQIRWNNETQEPVTNAYVMQLDSRVREVMLDYCDQMGITEKFRDLTYRGHELQANQERILELQGLNWYVQRPPQYWRSNMHWISPLDALSHRDYLQALSLAGFDGVLRSIGEYFGLDGLACYHVTFIAVSYSQKGYVHYDMKRTGNRVFNVIFPLILANNTGPELDLQAGTTGDPSLPIGRLKYEYDIATLIGDDAYHGTSAVDYSSHKEMRMAATVYIADIQEDNIDSIMADYTQNYPPPRRKDLLLRMAGTHWKRNDPFVRLPEPFSEDFESYPLAPNVVSKFIWKRTQKPVSDHVYRVGLPFNMQRNLLEFVSQLGIVEQSIPLLDDNEKSETHDNSSITKFGGFRWKIHETPRALSMMPEGSRAFNAFLDYLLKHSFDGVINSLGKHLGVNEMRVYGIAVVAVSKTVDGRVIYCTASGAVNVKLAHVIVPLSVESPEIEVFAENGQTGRSSFDVDEGLILLDACGDSTTVLDHRPVAKHNLFLSLLAGGTSEANVKVDFDLAVLQHTGEDKALSFRWSEQKAEDDRPRKQWWMF